MTTLKQLLERLPQSQEGELLQWSIKDGMIRFLVDCGIGGIKVHLVAEADLSPDPEGEGDDKADAEKEPDKKTTTRSRSSRRSKKADDK